MPSEDSDSRMLLKRNGVDKAKACAGGDESSELICRCVW
jgi:hypothetical protein